MLMTAAPGVDAAGGSGPCASATGRAGLVAQLLLLAALAATVGVGGAGGRSSDRACVIT